VLCSRGRPGDSDWGTGKTFIACALLASRIQRGLPARFLAMQDFLETQKGLFGGEGEAASAYADRMAAEPLLLLDDVGKEQPTPWAAAQIYRLINARWRAKRPTIVTTNAHSPDELAQQTGGAVASRLREALWLPVGGPDMRGAR
jgi:DNA replication protein DnaC